MNETDEQNVLRSETGTPLTVDEAARYYTWALDDRDPYRRGFARGVAVAARITTPPTPNPEVRGE